MTLFGASLRESKYYTYAQDGVLRVWDSPSSSWLRDVSSPDLARDKVYAVAGCDLGGPDIGEYAVYMGAQSGCLYWWTSATGAIRRLEPPAASALRPLHASSSLVNPSPGSIRSLAVDAGGRLLVGLSSTGVACTWALDGPAARSRSSERRTQGEPRLTAAVVLRKSTAQEFGGFIACAQIQANRLAFVLESTLFVTDLSLHLVNSRPLHAAPSCLSCGAGMIVVGSSLAPFVYVYALTAAEGGEQQGGGRHPRGGGQAQEIAHVCTINVLSTAVSVAIRVAPQNRGGDALPQHRRGAKEPGQGAQGGEGARRASGSEAGRLTRLFYVLAAGKRTAQLFVFPYRRATNPQTHTHQIFAAMCLQRFSAANTDRTVIFLASLNSVAEQEGAGREDSSAPQDPPPPGAKHSAVSASRELVSELPPVTHKVGLSLLRGTAMQPVMDKLLVQCPPVAAPFSTNQWQDPKSVLRPLRADVVSQAQTSEADLRAGNAQQQVAPSHISTGSAALKYFRELQDGAESEPETDTREDLPKGTRGARGGAVAAGGDAAPATSLEQLLRQGDKDRIHEILVLSTQAEVEVRIRSLTPAAVVLLLRRLAEYCSEPGAAGVKSALAWMSGVCREHRDLLASSQEAKAALGAVERSMEARMGYYQVLQRLHDIIYVNINRLEEVRTVQDPVVTLNLFAGRRVAGDRGEGLLGQDPEEGKSLPGAGEPAGEKADSEEEGEEGEESER